MPRNKSFDLLLVVVLALVAGVVVALNGPAWLRSVLTLSLIFILPGYALIAALFPSQEPDTSARLLMMIALSLALAAVGGLALHFTGLGLQSTTWTFLLMGIIFVGSVVAIVRRRQLPAPISLGQPISLKPVQLLLIAGAFGLVVAAVSISRSGALSQQQTGFSQLWMTPAIVAPTNDPTVKIGITNEEGISVRYGLSILGNDNEVLASWDDIDLGPGDHWQTNFTLPVTIPPLERLEARLYRADAPESVYRQVSLFLNASDGDGASP